jgi:hypothetical protein
MTSRAGILGAGLLAGRPRYVNETTPPRQATGAGGPVYLDTLAANTGTATPTLADATLSATGALRITGTLTATLADATLSATSAARITGTLSQTLADVTAGATGALRIAGTDTTTLDDLTLVATGALRISGTASATLADATLSATGALRITGTLAATLDDLTAGATATIASTNDLAAQVAAAKGAGGVSPKRRRRRKIEGAIAWALPRLGIAATGEASDPPEGEFRGSIAIPLQFHCRGAVGVRGAVRLTLPEFETIAFGFVAPCGHARVEFEPAVRAFGRHDHFNDAELALLPLILELA